MTEQTMSFSQKEADAMLAGITKEFHVVTYGRRDFQQGGKVVENETPIRIPKGQPGQAIEQLANEAITEEKRKGYQVAARLTLDDLNGGKPLPDVDNTIQQLVNEYKTARQNNQEVDLNTRAKQIIEEKKNPPPVKQGFFSRFGK